MKQFLLTILLLSLFFTFAGSIQAKVDTIVDFPDLPGAPDPTSGLPQFIKYVFVFSLGIVGLAGMVGIIYGAFGYVTSAGNPQKAADGKNQILSALLGLLLILGSWVLLNIINPDLLKLGITSEPISVTPEENGAGKAEYACYCCCYAEPSSCNPLSKPEYRQWCLSLTQTKADNDCANECKFSCVLNWRSQIVQESCD